MSKKITLVVFGDTHINSTIALCPPKVILDDGNSMMPSMSQRILWEKWCGKDSFIQDVKNAAKGGKLWVVANGDLIESDMKDRSYQTVTKNPATIRRTARDALLPLRDIADRWWSIRGTEAHGGKSNSFEEELAEDFGAEKEPETGSYSWWSLLIDINGFLFDITHHSLGDGREWTKLGSAVRLAKQTVIRCAERRERIPNFVIRSHTHFYNDSFDASSICRAITLPGWSFASAFSYRMGFDGRLADVGGLITTIDGTSISSFDIKRYPLPKRAIWTEKPAAKNRSKK